MSVADWISGLLRLLAAAVSGDAPNLIFTAPASNPWTEWGKVIVPAIIAVAVGIATLLKAQQHDREQRLRDDVREVLSATLPVTRAAAEAAELLLAVWAGRRNSLRDQLRVDLGLRTPEGDPFELDAYHAERAAHIKDADTMFGEAARQLDMRIEELALYVPQRSAMLATLRSLRKEMDVAWSVLSDPLLDDEGNFVAGEPSTDHRAARCQSALDVAEATTAFAEAARAYVQPRSGRLRSCVGYVRRGLRRSRSLHEREPGDAA